MKYLLILLVTLLSFSKFADASSGEEIDPLEIADKLKKTVPALLGQPVVTSGIPQGEFDLEDLVASFAGPITKENRDWTLSTPGGFDNEEFTSLTKDYQKLKLLDLNFDNNFVINPFEVDSDGKIRYTFLLASDSLSMPDDDDYSLNIPFSFTADLTFNEQQNPLVKALKMSMSFQEAREEHLQNPAHYEKTTGFLQAVKLIMFLQDKDKAENQLGQLIDPKEKL